MRSRHCYILEVQKGSENRPHAQEIMTSKKLYVGNLPYTTTDSDLRDLFSGAGNVESAAIISDKFSGRSKGFGFVEMSSLEEAEKAISMFNGQQMGGRAITVTEARPKPEGGAGRSFGGGGGGGSRGGYGGGNRGGYGDR